MHVGNKEMKGCVTVNCVLEKSIEESNGSFTQQTYYTPH